MRHRLSFLCLLPLLLWQPQHALAAGTIELPDMGDRAAAIISPEEEQRIGEEMMRGLFRSGRVIDDPELVQYIKALGRRLISSSDQATTEFTFFLLDDPAINAFAMPGGYIGVHSGLLLATRSESELAAVLAHEIAHVSQRHLARSFDKASKMNLPITAAVIAAIILGGQNPEVAEAAIATSIAGGAQVQLDFTREHEKEADRVGIQTLALAGFDPRSMPAFFERLQQETRYYGEIPEFLSTHPVTVNRIADSRNRAEQYPPRRTGQSLSYELTQAKLRVLASAQPKSLAQGLREELRQGRYRNEEVARYSLALALLKAGETAAAREEITRLLKTSPGRIAFLLAQAGIERTADAPERALAAYRKGLELYPGNGPLTLGYAETLLSTQQAEQARRLLLDYTRAHPTSAKAFALLSEAEQKLGNIGAAHLAQAEFHYLRGELHAAMDLLRQALRNKDIDFYHTTRIEARLKQLEGMTQQVEK